MSRKASRRALRDNEDQEDMLASVLSSKRPRIVESDDEVSTVQASVKLNIEFVIEALIASGNMPRYFYCKPFVGALIYTAEKMQPNEWRNIFKVENSEFWRTLADRYRSNCEETVKERGGRPLESDHERGRPLTKQDTEKKDWYRNMIKTLKTRFSNGEENGFSSVVCAFLVKLYDVRRDGCDQLPTRVQRLKDLGRLIIDRYKQVRHANQGWRRKICLPQSLLENFPKAALDSELIVEDADALHYETEEGDVDELVTAESRHLALPASQGNLNITTDEKLEQARRYLELQNAQLAALMLQVEAKKADVAKVELEVKVLEEKKAVEKQNEKIIATVRKIIPTSSTPDKLQDFTDLLALLEYIRQKTEASGFTEAIEKLLPTDLAKDYANHKSGNIAIVEPNDDFEPEEEPTSLPVSIQARYLPGPLNAATVHADVSDAHGSGNTAGDGGVQAAVPAKQLEVSEREKGPAVEQNSQVDEQELMDMQADLAAC